MKHRVAGRKFSRDTNQRKALFVGLSKSLTEKGELTTTLSKAKSLRPIFEKLISKAKRGRFTDRREVLKVLKTRQLVNKLFDEIAPKFKDRAGGYLRITHLSRRVGDNATLAKIELVEKLETPLAPFLAGQKGTKGQEDVKQAQIDKNK